MNLEDTLTQTFESRLDAVELPAGDVAGARSAGRRMRVRRRVAAGAAALAVLAASVAGALVSAGTHADGPADPTGQWRELPASPLSPRTGAATVWTGTEMLVIGGSSRPCEPTAACPKGRRDGAAYDPATNSWHRIAEAPVDLSGGARLVAADGKVVLCAFRRNGYGWYVYDPVADHWSSDLGGPPRLGEDFSVLGPSVFGITGRYVMSYDVRNGLWSRIPADPIRPRLAQRRVTATPDGTVVTGVDATRPTDGPAPSFLLADVWDGTTWRRLPPSQQLGGTNTWTWTGTRMVDPEPLAHDGGPVTNWGRFYPYGGTLDPVAGSWGMLPETLTWPPYDEHDGVFAAHGAWFAEGNQVFDDSTGHVYDLTLPPGLPGDGTSAAWAGDRLFVFGGVDYGPRGARGPSYLSDRTWLWTP